MKKFEENFEIVERLFMEEEKDVEFVARWLRMKQKDLLKCIDRYFRSRSLNAPLVREEYNSKLNRMKEIKEHVEVFLSQKRGRCVTIKGMTDHAKERAGSGVDKPYMMHEVKSVLKNTLGYSWRRGNTRPLGYLRQGIQQERVKFEELITLLEKMNFTLCYVDECSFNAAALPLYTWSKKGEEATKLIRTSTDRYNGIAALVEGR